MGLFRDSVGSAINGEREKIAGYEASSATRTVRLQELVGLILEDRQLLTDHGVEIRDGRTGMPIHDVDQITGSPVVLCLAKGVVAEIGFDTESGRYRVIDWEGREPGPFDAPKDALWFSDSTACVKIVAALFVKTTNMAGRST